MDIVRDSSESSPSVDADSAIQYCSALSATTSLKYMDYLYQYLIFLAEAVTVVVAILMILSALTSLNVKRQHGEGGHLEVRKLNDRIDQLKDGIRHALLDSSSFKKQHKQEAKSAKREAKDAKKAAKKVAKTDAKDGVEDGAKSPSEQHKNRTFVLDFKGDLQASNVKHLSTEITAIMTMAEETDEVVVRLEAGVFRKSRW